MRRGKEMPWLLDSSKIPVPDWPSLPHDERKYAAWTPCVTVSQCQFSKVPASDATLTLANQEQA